MTDVFISYSKEDEDLAQFVYSQLEKEGINPFLASVSIEPGQKWADEILNNLRSAEWVFFLASESACQSAYVQQELGGAILSKKTIIPIMLDIPASKLPGWISQDQAISIAKDTLEEAKDHISKVASKIKSKKLIGWLVIAAVVGGLIVLSKK